MPRKKATPASTSPEKPTPRRNTRRAKEPEEIPLHLLKASDESSENDDDDEDYGSPKKGGGGRGRGRAAAGGRGRKAKETPVVEATTPTTRPRRGRKAAVKDTMPNADIEMDTNDDQDHSQSTQEMSESTQEHDQQAYETVNIDENIGKVSEVSIEQDLQAYNQGNVNEEQEVNESNTNDVDVNMVEEPVKIDEEITQIDDSSEEESQQATQVIEPPSQIQNEPEVIQESPQHVEEEAPKVVEEPPKVEENKEIVEEKTSPSKYRYPHKDTPSRARSSSGEIHEEEIAKKIEEPEQPKKVIVEEKTATPSSTRKRKWGPRKTDDDPVIAITTDSLKTIISEEVKPVPLSDVKLLSPSPEREPEEKRQRTKLSAEDKDAKKKLLKERLRKQEEEEERRNEQLVKAIDKQTANNGESVSTVVFKDRKVSIVNDESSTIAPTLAENESSNILYITNLVRPFTVPQLRTLLARTGKIVEDGGFWIDKIKSKCYVKYESEGEAVETRHALNGVTWPNSNPKRLNVEFGSEDDMNKAIISTAEEARITITTENREVKDEKEFGWSKDQHKSSRDDDRSKTSRPVREWDVGKNDKEDFDRRGRRSSERESRRDRDKDDKRSDRADRRKSVSRSPVRESEVIERKKPTQIIDDLFRKTVATPSIYWLPLTAEQIAEKEEIRQKKLAENTRRMEKEMEMRQKRRSPSRERRRRSRSRSFNRRRRDRSLSRDRDRNNRYNRR